ncbi:unnamed protein product [Cylindrotheca closterium]|uniref:Uncharacterized protein n=1 Tax=Cylindrotheca closterium TaxID=2856 RepID=A0AAD2JQC2_9STRA|nr:unnamed protein product [Cylindrotheca closterium]
MKFFIPTNTPTTSNITMTNTIINYITTIITTIIVNQELIQAGISFFRLPVRMPLIITQTVRETITAGLVCAAALLLLWYMVLDLYRTYQGLCKQRNSSQQQPPVSILRRSGGSSHRKNNRTYWFGAALFRTPNRVHFAPFFQKRTFVPDEQELQSLREHFGQIRWQIVFQRVLKQLVFKCVLNELRSKVEKIVVASTLSNPQCISKATRSILTKLKIKAAKAKRKQKEFALKNHRQLLQTVLDDMLSNIPVPMDLDDAGNVEPNDMEDEEPRLALKRTATYCPVAPRPTKRRKLNSSTVPSSATEWAKRINERFTPLLPVIIEHPEEQEQDNFIDIESSLDAELIDDSIDSAEDPLEDTISDDEILAPPPEQSDDNTATIDIPPDGMGSGWTESGKRYSLRLAKLLIPHAEDPFIEALGSGMTEQEGRRYSHRVANRRSGTN